MSARADDGSRLLAEAALGALDVDRIVGGDFAGGGRFDGNVRFFGQLGSDVTGQSLQAGGSVPIGGLENREDGAVQGFDVGRAGGGEHDIAEGGAPTDRTRESLGFEQTVVGFGDQGHAWWQEQNQVDATDEIFGKFCAGAVFFGRVDDLDRQTLSVVLNPDIGSMVVAGVLLDQGRDFNFVTTSIADPQIAVQVDHAYRSPGFEFAAPAKAFDRP